ncbi:Glu/Leu/Phe/Val dehydrogenase dimerization domain-containing protein [Candidatus Palauibacter sp.]|uniref:Glu/Leu/Phe/Val dehydrogenase dimerization domain-containing protein n=1 Tax=Candidatus Palauibacter sp. TaxID=3101350 RepID=UPI003C6FA714
MHDTRLGPATGGTRMTSYETPVDGLVDAMRLAEGMTSKWASVGMRFGGSVVSAARMWDVEVDVYAPCAVGATLNPDTIPRLTCSIVAGSANNQLLSEADAEALHERGILYAPDYVINAGGAVAFGNIHQGERDPARLRARVERIGSALREMFEEAAAAGESPLHAAHRHAQGFLARHAASASGGR